ncbi:MAG: DnaJ family domain-containing protein [Candidatus Limnocylindrales bacterium]
MSPQRRDPDGKIHTAHSWESLVEKQIREAMEAGAFEELPYQGMPLPLEDDSAAGEWAMAHRMLRNAGVAPPWIESDKEARRLLGEIDSVLERASRLPAGSRHKLRAELRRLADEANRAVLRLNSEAPTPKQHRRPLDLAELLARLERTVWGG